MARPVLYQQGFREAGRLAVARLHKLVSEMKDPKAIQVLNTAAFDMGAYFKKCRNEWTVDE